MVWRPRATVKRCRRLVGTSVSIELSVGQACSLPAGTRLIPSKPPNQHTASSVALHARSPAASSHDSKCLDIKASSPVPISAMIEYSKVLRLKLKTTTSGKCRAPGICDLRDAVDLTGGKAENGEAGGEAAERRAVALTGVWDFDGGVLTCALAVSLAIGCDLAGRAISGGRGGEDGRLMCGRLRKIAFTRTRNMDVCRGEDAQESCPTSSFLCPRASRVEVYVVLQALVDSSSLVAALGRHRLVFPATSLSISLARQRLPMAQCCQLL